MPQAQQTTTIPMEVPVMTMKSDNREALSRFFKRMCTDLGEVSANKIARVLVEELGGLRVSVPDLHDLAREERNIRMRAQFDGRNYFELAFRFGISVRQVRNIIDGERRKQ